MHLENMELIYIDEKLKDPYINLSKEGQLLEDDLLGKIILKFWQNYPCIVIGKFQKEEYEVNLKYVTEKGIPVLRRCTGGGTVYHDLGVLNVTVAKRKENTIFSHYYIEEARGITEIIVDSIESLTGHSFLVDKRNAVFFEGKKVLGSSVAISKSNFLYHASILIEADLYSVAESLKGIQYPEDEKNFVKSIKSDVVNLSDISPAINMDLLKREIRKKFSQIPLEIHK